MKNRMYIICSHIGSITHPVEVFMDSSKAVARLYELRDANGLEDRQYSLQWAPLMDGENNID